MIDLDDIILKRKELKKIKDNFKKKKRKSKFSQSIVKKIDYKSKKERNKILENKEAELEFKENTINIYE